MMKREIEALKKQLVFKDKRIEDLNFQVTAKDAEIHSWREKQSLDQENKESLLKALEKRNEKVEILRWSLKNFKDAVFECTCMNSSVCTLMVSEWFTPGAERHSQADAELLLENHEPCMFDVRKVLEKSNEGCEFLREKISKD